jgi:hypothetical protein|tara:strand:+ start:803 stop:955 length:153 start_codon:yes stop_codon:yes gene_type:complete
MKNFYKRKMEFHFKEYQLCIDSNKEKAAEHHMKEYLNYQEMYEQQEDKAT